MASSRIFFLSTLANSADAEDFERFVREEVLPLARAFPSVHSYTVSRVEGYLEDRRGSPPFQYLDVAEVTSPSAYESDVAAMLESDAGPRFEEKWSSLVADWTPLHGSAIE